MLIKTKWFGEVDIEEDKIITFEHGLMGFNDYKRYTILYDIEEEGKHTISWLQSVEEESLALPVMNPNLVYRDYNPIIEDELLKSIGELNEENIVILLTVSASSDVKKTSVNLKAPLIINSDTKKGIQVIADNSDYPIKYNVYEAVQKMKKEEGEV